MMDLFLANPHLFTSQDINWWTGVTCGLLWCFYQLLDSHSDGTHSLQRIHWWASHVMLHFSKSWWRNKLIYILDGLRMSIYSVNFHFWVNFSFNSLRSLTWARNEQINKCVVQSRQVASPKCPAVGMCFCPAHVNSQTHKGLGNVTFVQYIPGCKVETDWKRQKWCCNGHSHNRGQRKGQWGLL